MLLRDCCLIAGGENGHREVSLLSRCGPASQDWRLGVEAGSVILAYVL